MLLHVQYKDFSYDYVDADTLDKLIANKTIQWFYRPSEKRLINVFSDPIRGIGGDYSGSERRQHISQGIGFIRSVYAFAVFIHLLLIY